MSLHTDWTDAKKDSKAKYKLAVKAKKAALEKDIKTGDMKARSKMLDQNLSELGIDDSSDDVDAYFKFKEGFGPALDKYEKAMAANRAIDESIRKLTSFEHVLADAKLLKAFVPVAKRTAIDDFLLFVTTGYKSDPAQAVATFIREGAPKEVNVDEQFLRPLRDLAGNPAQLKAQGPALLRAVRDKAVQTLGPDALSKFRNSPEAAGVFGDKVNLAPLKQLIETTADSYKRQVEAKASAWKNINPDFRKPLLDAIATIKAAL